MTLSLGSIAGCFGIILIFTVCLALIMKSENMTLVIKNKFVFAGIILILLRLLIPFNFPFTITIPVSQGMPQITDAFFTVIGEYNIFTYFLAVWGLGAAIKIILWLVRHYKTHKLLVNISHLIKNEAYVQLCENLNEKIKNMDWKCRNTDKTCTYAHSANDNKKIEVLIAPFKGSPVISGIFHPKILLPEYMLRFPEEYIYDVISHELCHYRKHDLWIVFLLRLLVCIYWWNPFIYILQDRMLLILELDSDRMILEERDLKGKYDYAECLIQVSKINTGKTRNLFHKEGIPLLRKKTTLELRINRILAFEKHDRQNPRILEKINTVLLSLSVLAALVLVPEAYSILESDSKDTFDITPQNAYLIEVCDEYQLYINGEYTMTMEEIDADFEDLPVY